MRRTHKVLRMLARRWAQLNPPNDPLADKAALAATVAKYAKDGEIALVIWQMDCDCSSWTSKTVVPATLVAIGRALSNVYDGAEGPVRWHVASPDVKVERNSRDHALEAFEEGHPHAVYA